LGARTSRSLKLKSLEFFGSVLHIYLTSVNQQHQLNTKLWSKKLTPSIFEYSVKNEAILTIVGTEFWEKLTSDDLYACPTHAKVTVSHYIEKNNVIADTPLLIKYCEYRVTHKTSPIQVLRARETKTRFSMLLGNYVSPIG